MFDMAVYSQGVLSEHFVSTLTRLPNNKNTSHCATYTEGELGKNYLEFFSNFWTELDIA